MAKVKFSIVEHELLRVLHDGNPDAAFCVNDEEFVGEPVDGYLSQTLAARVRTQGDISVGVARLVRDGLVRFVNVPPSLLNLIIGKRAVTYGYLTILGREAAASPASYLGKPLERDDLDRRYEPKGMWLRQIEGLPPRED